MNFGTLLLLFILVPVGELWLLFKIADLIGEGGGLITFGLVIITGMIGAGLAKGQGAKVIRAIKDDLSAGQMPTDHLLSGMLVLVGGVLLVTPGVTTDLVGLFLMIPGNRRMIIPLIKKRFARNIQIHTNFGPSFGPQQEPVEEELQDYKVTDENDGDA